MALRTCTYDLIQKTCSVGKRTDVKVVRQRLTEIGKGLASSQIDFGAHPRAGQKNRDVLTRVIGARRRRIVAVVCGNDEQVGVAQSAQHVLETFIESLEVGRIAVHVVPMAELRIEVDEVDEDETFALFVNDLHQVVEPVSITPGRDGAIDAPAREEVANLPNRNDWDPAPRQQVQQSVAWWRRRVIMADDLTDLIRRNPIPALLVGVGVGFLLARATTSRS